MDECDRFGLPLRDGGDVLIVSNIASFPAEWTAADGTSGQSRLAQSAGEFLRYSGDPEAIFLVNCASRIALELAAHRMLPFAKSRPIVALDLVFLRRPHTLAGKLGTLAKRLLLRKVDYFLHYFKDVRALEDVYDIGADRSGYVDFKANLWSARADAPQPDGDYALCFGRSLRDFDTFFDAVEASGITGAIVNPRPASLTEHGSRFSRPLDKLPVNVRVLDDDGTEASQAAALRGAKVVVVPMVRGRLIAAGISTILNAMLLGKCVIATAGPGVSDIFDDQLLSVPAQDPAALGATLRRVWDDDDLRRRTARAGWEYARRCGSEKDFNQRVIDAVVSWRASRQALPRDTRDRTSAAV